MLYDAIYVDFYKTIGMNFPNLFFKPDNNEVELRALFKLKILKRLCFNYLRICFKWR